MTFAIRAQQLTKRYGSAVALNGLEIEVRPGEVFGYLGPNGAGKTTTIRLLLGLHRPTSGRIEVFGADATRDPVTAHRRLAYVPAEPALWPGLTAAETLEFLGNVGGGRVDRHYRASLIDQFELDASKKVRALSKGNRQKVQLIAALASRAELLVMDEPTGGLDPLMEVVFRGAVREARDRGQTVFLSSHILSEVEALCDRVGLLRAGKLVDQGTLKELRHLSTQTVEVSFAGPAPKLPRIPGVSHELLSPSRIHFEVPHENGAMRQLLQALAGQQVTTLTARDPSLEEIFIHHYTSDAAAGLPSVA